jgi:hypothetical protein
MKTKAVAIRLTETEVLELEKRAGGKKLPAYIKSVLFSTSLEQPVSVSSPTEEKMPAIKDPRADIKKTEDAYGKIMAAERKDGLPYLPSTNTDPIIVIAKPTEAEEHSPEYWRNIYQIRQNVKKAKAIN